MIIFTAYLRPDDTARVVGITEGLTSGGDLERGATLPDTKFGKVPKKKKKKYRQQFPQRKTIIFSEEVIFDKGQSEATVSVPTLVAKSS